MKNFLYGIGTLAEAGIFAIAGLLFWVFTEWDALEIVSFDAVITLFVSLLIFLKIEEIEKGEKRNGKNY